MATSRVKIIVTDPQFFEEAQNRKSSVRAWDAPARLPHFVEIWDGVSGFGIVWVKIHFIPAGGSVVLRMYYGNPYVVNKSEGDLTFIFFDDFEGSDTKLNYTVIGATYTFSTDYAIHGNYSVKYTETSTTAGGALVGSANLTASVPYAVEAWVMPKMNNAIYQQSYYVEVLYNIFAGYENAGTTDSPYIEVVNANTATKEQATAVDLVQGEWYRIVGIVRTDGKVDVRIYNKTGSLVSSFLSANTYYPTYSPKVGFKIGTGAGQTGSAYVDVLKVYKYNEDVTVEIGPEQPSDVLGWLYMREIKIINASDTDLTEFQIRLQFDGTTFDFSHTAPDASDIRFEFPEKRRIPYYIESWDSTTASAVVWAKVPYIPPNGTADFYIYYGNPEATSESDADSVFILFDDFNGTALDTTKWVNSSSGSATVAVSNGYLELVGDGTYRGWVNSVASMPANLTVELRGYNGTGGAIYLATHYDGTHTASYDQPTYALALDSGDNSVKLIDNGVITVLGTSVLPTATTADTVIGFKYGNGNLYIYQSGSQVFTASGITPPDYYLLGLAGNYTGSPTYIDWVRVRKFADSEPTVTVGAEELSDLPGWKYRRKVTVSNPNQYALLDYQVRVELNSTNFTFSNANPDGSDVRTYYVNRHKLPYYIEVWDTTTPEADIWVGIDNQTKIYLEVNPLYVVDESDPTVLNLPLASVVQQTITRYS